MPIDVPLDLAALECYDITTQPPYSEAVEGCGTKGKIWPLLRG
jgi:hypothetical protein